MPSRAIGVTDNAEAAGIVDVSAAELPMLDVSTTLTADPGSGGTTLAITSAARFPVDNQYKVRVENEVMLVTAGAGTASWTVTRGIDGTTAVAHAVTTPVYLIGAVQRVIPALERITTFEGYAASFRTLGSAAVPQNIFSIENASSAIMVAVKRLMVGMDASAAQLAIAPEYAVTRSTALPTGGTALSKGAGDTALTSNASVVARGATASDGGAATAITATAGAARMFHQFQMRMATQVGQMLPGGQDLLPPECWDDPIILRNGEALLLQVIGTAASNAATNHYVAKAAWEEFRAP